MSRLTLRAAGGALLETGLRLVLVMLVLAALTIRVVLGASVRLVVWQTTPGVGAAMAQAIIVPALLLAHVGALAAESHSSPAPITIPQAP